MTSPGDPESTHQKRRPAWTEALVIACILIAGLAVLLGLGVIQLQPKNQTLPPPPPAPAPPPGPAETFALEALEKFFEGADVADKAKAVKDPERVRPMMEDFHGKRGHPFPTMGRVSPGKAVTIGTRQCVFFEVEPFSGPRFPVSLEWDGFRFGVDWESLTAYGTMDWSKFAADKPAAAQVMRVYVGTLPEGMRPPGATAGWQAFRTEHRDSDMVLLALAGPELSRNLEKLVKGKRVPLTVEMRWNAEAATGGTFEILRVVAEGWSQ